MVEINAQQQPDNTTQNNNNDSSTKMLKVAMVAMSILAICGIGFGIYGMMQSSDKDNQISNLKAQLKDTDSTTVNIDIDENTNDKSFLTNILANLKNLGDSTYGFKSINLGNRTIYTYISSDGDLILEKDDKYTVASNVIFADFLWEGNGGTPSLYFVKSDGSVGVVKDVAYNTENPIAEEVVTDSKAVSVKNITTQGGHKVIIIDTDGNFIDLQ